MPSKIIDLSVSLRDKPTKPEHHRPEIKYFDHKSDESWSVFERYYPGVSREDIVDGEAFAVERVSLNTHAGTHMDAPWHYHSTTNHQLSKGGEPSMTIDQVPLEWCFCPGVKLDFRDFSNGYVASAKDVEDELRRIQYELKPLDVVLVNTPASGHHEDMDYGEYGVGVGREATLYLLERGVRMVGIDAFSWDAPFSYTSKKFAETRDAGLIWEGHKAGRDIGYYQMEKLTNLESLPAHGFKVACFPIKIEGASAAWTRVVGILDDG